MKILSLVFPGFTFVDLAAPMQAFSMLPEAKSQIAWQKKGIVASDAGVDVHATEDFHSCWKDPDILFVPGNTLALFRQLQDDACNHIKIQEKSGAGGGNRTIRAYSFYVTYCKHTNARTAKPAVCPPPMYKIMYNKSDGVRSLTPYRTRLDTRSE